MGGLRVLPDLTLDKLKPTSSGMLVLPGGDAWDKKKNKATALMAAEFLAKEIPVAAICGATVGLARIGLLDDIPYTQQLEGIHRSHRLESCCLAR